MSRPAAESVEDRAIGCLLGLAVGDALGTTLEFQKRDTCPPLTTMVGGGALRRQPGEWTDDTAMALALADSLLSCGRLDERDLLERFCAWWQDGAYSCVGVCDDIGLTTRAALQHFLATGEVHSGSADQRSAGNGSLMRLAPVAIRYRSDAKAREDASRRQSLTTHGAASAVSACIVFSDILANAIGGADKEPLLRPRYGPIDPAIAEVARGSWRCKSRDDIRSGGYVADTLEAALWSFGTTKSFEEAMLLAVNLAGDADTVGAVTGQLAGAFYGAAAIADHLGSEIAWRPIIVDLAKRLHAA